MSDYEEIKKRLAEAEKLIEVLQKRTKRDHENLDWNNILGPLQSNFPKNWIFLAKTLRNLFLKDPGNPSNRRALQMALLGVVWTEISKIPEIDKIKRKLNDFKLSSVTFDLKAKDDNNIWKDMDASAKTEIFKWADKFRASPNVKPEALISGNLWGYILRKMTMSIEENGNDDQNDMSQMQLYGEFKTATVEAIGANFFTDFAITAGCKGLPLFLAELESRGISKIISRSADKDQIHKDMKKLSIQMAGVLLKIIGIIRNNSKSEIDISDLKTFGALISDTKIEFFVSRPVIFRDDKWIIVFESHPEQWRFDLYENVNYCDQDMEIENPTENNMESESTSESDDLIVEIEKDFNSIYEEEIIYDFETETESTESPLPSSSNYDFSKPIGRVNEKALEALANFLGKVHAYYRSFNETLKHIYTNPEDYDADSNLKYPEAIHKEFHTSKGNTPEMEKAKFFDSIKQVSNTNDYAEFDVPSNFIFTTLPSVLHVRKSDKEPSRVIVRYAEGLSLPEIENLIEQNIEQMESDRAYYRSALILGISMGVYMASRSGIGFDLFTADDITFRNGIFCIKTYTHARPITTDFSVLDVVKRLRSFYIKLYMMDQIMIEGDPKYVHLTNIERIIFGRIGRFNTDHNEEECQWLTLFKDAKKEFESILDERFCFHQRDSTWFLLENLISKLELTINTKSL